MNGSQLCFFSILVLSAFSQAKGEHDSGIMSKAIQILQDRALENGDFNTLLFTNLLKSGNWRLAGLIQKGWKNYIVSNRNEIITKANMELASLKGNRDSCSLKKSRKIRAAKSELKALSSCLNLSGTLASIKQFVNNTVELSLVLAFDIGNLTTSIINCTVSSDKTQCIIDNLQTAENDVNDFFPKVGSLVAELISLIIDIAKDILGCFHSTSSLETNLRYMINTKCNGDN